MSRRSQVVPQPDPYAPATSRNADSESSTRLNPPAAAPSAGSIDWTGSSTGKTPEQIVADYVNAAKQGNPPGINILRNHGTTTWTEPVGGIGTNRMQVTQGEKRVSEDEFAAEYWTDTIKDDAKRNWMAKRLLVLANGGVPYDPNSPTGVKESDLVNNGFSMWNWAAKQVQLDPSLSNMTPEEFLDGLYQKAGGDAALEAIKAKTNPIQTSTQHSVHTISLTKAESDAIADKVAMATLGRMASDSEMAKARKAMNSLLKANPSVSDSTTVSNTDTNTSNTTSTSKEGLSASGAADAYEQKLRRSSEGMAFGVGKAMEQAMAMLDRGL